MKLRRIKNTTCLKCTAKRKRAEYTPQTEMKVKRIRYKNVGIDILM